MGKARTPAGTRLFMQSDITAKQSIVSITKGSPAVIEYSGSDPASGSYVALTDLFGMTEFEGALVKAANVNTTANTFEAEDQSAIGYNTFQSGNLQVLTMATEIGDGTGFTISGFEQQFAEYNLLRDRITRKVPTVVSSGNIEIPMLWDPADATAALLRNAADTGKQLGFKVLFADGLEMLFFGTIGASGMPKVDNNNSIITTSITISMDTRPRYVLP